MLDRHLRGAKEAKHRMELAPGGEHPIHSEPYPASQSSREIEKHQIDKMLAMAVIDLA